MLEKYRLAKIKEYEMLQTQELITNDFIRSPNVIIITASMDKQSYGTVTGITENVRDTLGWGSSEIVGKYIHDLIMPGGFKRLHPGIVEAHLKSKSSSMLNKNIKVYAKSKMGEIYQAHIYLAIYPRIKNGIEYMCFLKVDTKSMNPRIIVNKDGYIEDFSASLGLKELASNV